MSGRFNIAMSATLEHAVMAENEQLLLMASDAGYGFVANLPIWSAEQMVKRW